jgi:hypothetical protein
MVESSRHYAISGSSLLDAPGGVCMLVCMLGRSPSGSPRLLTTHDDLKHSPFVRLLVDGLVDHRVCPAPLPPPHLPAPAEGPDFRRLGTRGRAEPSRGPDPS